MRTTFFLYLAFFTILSGCDNQVKQDLAEVSVEFQNSIRVKLESIALEFLKSWEPPFDPEAAIGLFTQCEDFHLVIDGLEIDNYMYWAENVPHFMAHDDDFYSSYKHELKYIETVVLSPQSGVVTIVYIWDSISKEGVHERTPGAITLTCRKENEAWKIVHYHGSHDDPEVIY